MTCSTTRIPLPPPPAAALISMGYPILCAIDLASSTSVIFSSVPGTIGTSKAFTVALALSLSPIISIASAEGPMRVMFSLTNRLAKSAFSDKKPYPG